MVTVAPQVAPVPTPPVPMMDEPGMLPVMASFDSVVKSELETMVTEVSVVMKEVTVALTEVSVG